MAATVLVTGSPERVEQVVTALRAAGAEAVGRTDLDRLDAELAAFAPGSLAGYVQLPVSLQVTGETVVSRVRGFLESGLLSRFRLAEAVLPALSADSRVLLVAGHTPVDRSTPDDQAARVAFLEVLAHAIRADLAPAKVRVRVLDHRQPPADIARLALAEPPAPAPGRWPEQRNLAEREAELSYQDWRTEVLGLARIEV